MRKSASKAQGTKIIKVSSSGKQKTEAQARAFQIVIKKFENPAGHI